LLPADDLDSIVGRVGQAWEPLSGKRLFLTGGTGFFGKWLVGSFLRANDRLGLGASLHLLTRSPERFRAAEPALANHPAVTLVPGDLRDFPFPEGGFSHCLHAATDADTALIERDPAGTLAATYAGTERVLAFCRQAGVGRFLLTSSGAVYGVQAPDLPRVPESYPGAPDPQGPASAYGEGKRLAELLLAIHRRQWGLQGVVARCWAFVGPHLPLEAHFAVGNFIGAALRREPIIVKGDGTPARTYLYASDLAWWLWRLLLAAPDGTVCNVGAEEEVSIAGVARLVAEIAGGGSPVRILGTPVPGRAPARYVPAIDRAAGLGLRPSVPLRAALEKTLRFYAMRPT